MDLLTGLFSAFGLSASAGLNAYIPLLTIALIGRFTDWIKLSSPWDNLENPWVIGTLVVLLAIEFFADKAPAFNHVNDVFQTIVRPVAGAIVFAASAKVISDMHPVVALIAGLLVAGGVHTVKSAAVRPAVTMTTAGAANVPISLLEDLTSTGISILSVLIPLFIAILIILFIAWIVWRLWRKANKMQSIS